MQVCTFWQPFSNTPFSHSLHFEFNGSHELNKYCCVHNVKWFMYKNYGISTTLDKPVSFKTVFIIKLTRKKKNQTILLTYCIFLTEFFCAYISMYVNTFWKIRIVSDFCSLPFVTRSIWVSWSKHKSLHRFYGLHGIPLFWVHPDLLNLSSLGSFRLCTVADNSSNI